MTTEQGRKTYGERLKVLMDVTLVRASSSSRPQMAAREVKGCWGLGRDAREVRVFLNGLAETQFDTKCDECGVGLPKGQTVAGKGIVWSDGSIISSCFAPTCISCFVQDRGGYLSLGIAYLVMES